MRDILVNNNQKINTLNKCGIDQLKCKQFGNVYIRKSSKAIKSMIKKHIVSINSSFVKPFIKNIIDEIKTISKPYIAK